LTSSQAPNCFNKSTACLVFLYSWAALLTTSGISGTSSTLWPLAITRAGTPVAAMALVIAYRRWLMLHRLCHRLQVLSGANILPPRHMLPKAAWPDRWVPPPRTRGIRATARPVPQDSAEVCSPAIFFTPVACRAFFRRLVWTKLTRSLRIGALNTAGVLTWPAALPDSS